MAAVLTTGCKAGKDEAPDATCVVEAAPSAAPVGGDANGDGRVDVSDGAWLARYAFAGGLVPVCLEGVDLVPDGAFNVGDIVAVWYSLGPKSAPYRPEVSAKTCPEVARTVDPPCASVLELAISAPASVSGAAGAPVSVDVSVAITSPELPVEAWSFTLTASGCTLESGTTLGTDAADKADGSSGLRDGGMAWQLVTGAEAQVLTVLDWRKQGTLPTGSPRSIHAFTVSGVPAAGCGTCTLALVPGDPVAGVESVVSAEGWRYVPTLGSASIQLCAE